MAVVITVNGVDRGALLHRGTLRILMALNGRDQLSAEFRDPSSTASAYRPAILDVIKIVYDGETVFEGEIKTAEDSPILEPDRGTRTKITAVGMSELADRLIINAPFGSQTLYEVASSLITTHLGPYYSVTAGFPSSGGPLLPDLAFPWKKISTITGELCKMTGYLSRITPAKVWKLFEPFSIAGPRSITATNGVAKELRWRQSAVEFFNSVWVIIGTAAPLPQVEYVRGDGSTHLFPLEGTPITMPGTIDVTIGGVTSSQPVGVYLEHDMAWTYRASDHAIIHRLSETTLSASDYIKVAYDEQGPIALEEHDQDSIDTYGLRATSVEDTTITSRVQGRAVAAGILARGQVTAAEVDIRTRTQGWEPGQVFQVDFPNRLLTGDMLLEEVEITDTPVLKESVLDFLTWRLRGRMNGVFKGRWVDFWQNLMSGGASGGSFTSGGAPVVTNGQVVFWCHLGGSSTTALYAKSGQTRWPIPNQAPVSIAGSRIPGGKLLRGKVKVSNTSTRARLILVNETDTTEVYTDWSPTGGSPDDERYLSLSVSLVDTEKVYKVEVEFDSAADGNFFWATYATLENR